MVDQICARTHRSARLIAGKKPIDEYQNFSLRFHFSPASATKPPAATHATRSRADRRSKRNSRAAEFLFHQTIFFCPIFANVFRKMFLIHASSSFSMGM